eukprot:3807866-Prymnesium_polylepis.1
MRGHRARQRRVRRSRRGTARALTVRRGGSPWEHRARRRRRRLGAQTAGRCEAGWADVGFCYCTWA